MTAIPVPQVGTHRAPHVLLIPAELWDLSHAALVTQGLLVDSMPTTAGQPPRHALRLRALQSEQPLTEREQQVLLLLATGARDYEMAASLFLSPHTVRSHLKTLFKKLGVRERSEAVAVGYQRRLLGGAA